MRCGPKALACGSPIIAMLHRNGFSRCEGLNVATQMTEGNQASGPVLAAFMANRSELLAFIRRVGANEHADDVLQEAWIRLNGMPDTAVAEPLSYCYRLVHNLILDRQRSAIRTLRRDEAWVDTTGPADRNVSEAPSADRILVAREQLAAVERCLEDLGEPTATIFRRHRIGGELQRNIAMEMGVGISKIERHLRKAYRALLKLGETFDDG